MSKLREVVTNNASVLRNSERDTSRRSRYAIQGDREMKVRYFNHQDELDPMNGLSIEGAAKLEQLLDSKRAERHSWLSSLVTTAFKS